MEISGLFFDILNIAGTISFAISGTMIAVKKQADLFGVLFLAVITAVGGGIVRDILLGIAPPSAFTNSIYAEIAICTGAVLFFVLFFFHKSSPRMEVILDEVNNLVDAVGLGIFSVTGVEVALGHFPSSGLFFCSFLGMVTGVGGGLLRDICVREIPFVLKKHIYAVASLAGSGCFWLLRNIIPADPAALIAIILVFVIRVLATIYRWNLPRIQDK